MAFSHSSLKNVFLRTSTKVSELLVVYYWNFKSRLKKNKLFFCDFNLPNYGTFESLTSENNHLLL